MTGPQVQMVSAAAHPRLRSLVSGSTGYHIRSAPGVHRGLPSRHLTLVVTIEGTVDVAADGRRRSFGALAGGLNREPVLIEHDGHQYGLQADLTPLGARALFGLPAGELAGSVVDLDAVLGPAATELGDRFRAATTWTDRFTDLDAVLARVAVQASGPAPELGWAWRRLVDTGGRVAVGTLAAEVGWSRQHLGATFRREYGLTPKLAARVMRFERVRALLAAPDRPGLAEIAARCGYADQAHLDRDWHELAGSSPSTWLAAELPFVQDGAVPAEGS